MPCFTHRTNGAGAWNITIVAFNTRSAVRKAGEILLAIENVRLDVLAVSETWIQLDAPDAISNDMLPPGFHGIGAPRPDRR